ncbi:MAG: MarR family transcriptional regulator [Clostridia bacterium]|nr:MarR family transcriptional regulator [Clostridia bacterium]
MQQKSPPHCPPPDSPHMKAIWLFMRVMRRHHACVERRIGDLGIHHSQHRMLMQLARPNQSPPSQKELAEIMGISPAAVTATLKKLEREGYISRSMTDEDNRKNEIRITEKGLSKVADSRAVFEATDRAMFEGFTPEEMETFISFMERLDRNLDAAGAPTDPPPPPHHSGKEEKP